MTTLTSQLEITNIALTLLGVKTLTATSDDTEPGRASLALFGPARMDVLALHHWRFASDRAVLPQLAHTPAFGFSYACQLPWDYVGCPIPDNDLEVYSIEGQEYLTNTDEDLGDDLATNGAFASDASWTKGTGWTIAGGVASHAAGTASNLSQDMSLEAESWYKVGYTLSGVSAGSLTVKAGSSGFRRSIGAARSADGAYVEALLCRGDSTLYFYASADFAGSLDEVTVQPIASAPGLLYVRDVTDVTTFPYGFAQTLAAYLAYQLTFLLTNVVGKRPEMFELYQLKLGQAKLASAREGSPKAQRAHSWRAKRA